MHLWRMMEPRPLIRTLHIESFLAIDFTHKMGKGTYGEVYLARSTKDSHPVVAKIIPAGDDETAMCQKYLFREISVWKKLSHPNLVRLRQVYLWNKPHSDGRPNFFFVLECENGGMSLDTTLRALQTPMAEAEVQSIAHQALLGLAYLHRHQFFHRDIKEANILIDRDRRVTLCDFGFVRRIDLAVSEYTEHIGTWAYMSPEQAFGRRAYSCQVDIWSLGVVVLNLVLRVQFFFALDCKQIVQRLVEVFGKEKLQELDLTPTEQAMLCQDHCRKRSLEELLQGRVSPTGTDLILRMLEVNPLKRIEAVQALRHPWFEHLREKDPPLNESDTPNSPI